MCAFHAGVPRRSTKAYQEANREEVNRKGRDRYRERGPVTLNVSKRAREALREIMRLRGTGHVGREAERAILRELDSARAKARGGLKAATLTGTAEGRKPKVDSALRRRAA